MLRITKPAGVIDFYKNDHFVWIGAVFVLCIWLLWCLDDVSIERGLRGLR